MVTLKVTLIGKLWTFWIIYSIHLISIIWIRIYSHRYNLFIYQYISLCIHDASMMYPSCIHQPGSFHCIGFPAGSLSRARAESTSCRSMVLAGWLNGMAGYPLGPRTPKGRRNWRMFLYVYITLYILYRFCYRCVIICTRVQCVYMYVNRVYTF